MAIIIEMPKLSDTMTVGTLVNWLKKEGQKVTSGDKLAEVETDKATMELDNFDEGVILKHYVKEGQEIPVGAPICAIGEPGEKAPEIPSGKGDSKKEAPKAEPKKEEKAEAPKKAEKAAETPSDDTEEEISGPGCVPTVKSEEGSETVGKKVVADATDRSPGERIKVSPLARKIAADKNVDLASVKGTGPGGRIVAEDVEKAAAAPKPAPKAASAVPTLSAPIGETTDVPVTNIRKVIAARLLESKTTVPHFYLEIEIDAAPLLELRAALNSSLGELPPEQGGIKLTVNDFILKASAQALVRKPLVNRSWLGDSIRNHGSVHLAFGVAIEDGLVTPVIRDAQTKGLRQIALEAKALIGKARAKKLTPNEMSGSTFTVTNLGMFGISNFYGIINPPNAAILSVGATIKKPIVDAKNNIVVGQRMNIGLSCDHRVVDGAVGAEFLVALKELLETPALMLV